MQNAERKSEAVERVSILIRQKCGILMNEFDPNSLPEFDAVEVVDLHGVRINRVDENMDAAQQSKSWRVIEAEAAQLAEYWRSMKAGETARCHSPPFGLRFFFAGKLVFSASVCWQCNNIFYTKDGVKGAYEFDATGRAARQLLAEAQRITGITVME